MQSLPRPGRISATPPLLTLALGALAAVACGGGSNEEAFAEFTGTWSIDESSTFSVSCPNGATGDLGPPWRNLVLEPGTITDLYEAECGFSFDVQGKSAKLLTTDAFTNQPAACSSVVDQVEDQAEVVSIVPAAADAWTFALQPLVKGKPPTATLKGSGEYQDRLLDLTNRTVLDQLICTYVVNASLTKTTKH